jgi:hypothetical protein
MGDKGYGPVYELHVLTAAFSNNGQVWISLCSRCIVMTEIYFRPHEVQNLPKCVAISRQFFRCPCSNQSSLRGHQQKPRLVTVCARHPSEYPAGSDCLVICDVAYLLKNPWPQASDGACLITLRVVFVVLAIKNSTTSNPPSLLNSLIANSNCFH